VGSPSPFGTLSSLCSPMFASNSIERPCIVIRHNFRERPSTTEPIDPLHIPPQRRAPGRIPQRDHFFNRVREPMPPERAGLVPRHPLEIFHHVATDLGL